MQNERLVTKETVIKVALIFIMIGMIYKGSALFGSDVNWDTNYYLNIGSNFIERNEVTPYMWRLGADSKIIAGSGTGYGVYILTVWLKVFGLSLLSGYALMYIAGVLSLIVLYFLAKNWWQSDIAGIIAVAYIGLTGTFISLYYVRMDALGILAYLLVLLLHIRAVQREKIYLHFFVGVAIIAAAEIHIQAILYIASLSLYYFVEQIRYLRQERKLFAITPSVAFFSGALIAGIIYLILHVLPDPQSYFIIAQECPNCSPAGFFKEFQRLMRYLFFNQVEMLIFVLALGVAYLRRNEADKHFFILFLGYIIAQGIVSPPAQVEYAAHMLPFFGLAVGGIFVKAGQDNQTVERPKVFLATLVGAYLVLSQLLPIAALLADKNGSEGVSYVQRYIPHDVVVMGTPPLYHELLDYPNFLSYNSGESYGIVLRGEDYATFYEREAPQVFIGQPSASNKVFWNYLHQHNFQQIRDNVWISGGLLNELIGTQSEPTLDLTVSATEIEFGNCIDIEWTVTGADAVFFEGKTVEELGSQTLCPNSATDYTLMASWVGEPVIEVIRVEVE